MKVAQLVETFDGETAVDMLTFALSGPGFVAFAALISVGLFLFLSFGELGVFFQRNRGTVASANNPYPYMLRVILPKRSGRIEFPEEGVGREISRGESIFKFSSLQALNVVAGQIKPIQGAKFFKYQLNGMSVRTLAKWPPEKGEIDAEVSWPKLEDGVPEEEKKADNPMDPDLQRVWDEYEQMGAFGKLDKEWKDYVDKNLRM